MTRKNNYIYKFILIILICILFFPGISAAKGEPKIGLALGEGGARGFAHVGVIKVLKNEGINIDYIAGTSIGSLVGSLYALGFPIEEIEEIVLKENYTEYITFENIEFQLEQKESKNIIGFTVNLPKILVDPSWPRGLISTTGIRDRFDSLTNWAHFEYDLKIPFKAVATDLITGDKIIMEKGKVSNAVAASISIPGMFSPFEFEDKILVDGGLKDPVPVDIVREMGADIVIAVSLRGIKEERKDSYDVFSITERTINIMLTDLTKPFLADADIIIAPEYEGKVSLLMNEKDRVKIIELGENEAIKKMPEIKKVIADF